MKKKLSLILALLLALAVLASCRKPQEEMTLPVTPPQTDPARLPEADPDPVPPDPPAAQGTEPVPQDADRAAMLDAYAGVLDALRAQCGGSGTDSQFAVYDIDGDGAEELICVYTLTTVYGYDRQTGAVREELSGLPGMIFYSTGAVEAPASHSQGRALDEWPYTLYQYDAAADVYRFSASVDSWDRRVADGEDWGEVPFPAETDADGDGVVYYILPEGGYAPQGTPSDNADYQAWRASWQEGAAVLEIPFVPLSEEAINELH